MVGPPLLESDDEPSPDSSVVDAKVVSVPASPVVELVVEDVSAALASLVAEEAVVEDVGAVEEADVACPDVEVSSSVGRWASHAIASMHIAVSPMTELLDEAIEAHEYRTGA